MKRIISFCILVMFCQMTSAQTFQWAKTTSADSNYGMSYFDMCIDANENVYTIGTYKGTVDLDPSSGTFYKTAVGENDFYISKLDSNGNLVWAHSFGSVDDDYGFSIDIDNFGFIYVAGSFKDSLDFDPSNSVYKLAADTGYYSAFVSKLDTSGNFIWAKAFQPSSVGYDGAIIHRLKVDKSNNIIIRGSMKGQIDFDPSANNYNLGVSNNTTQYPFVLKLSATGHLIWVKRIEVANGFSGSIGIDASNAIYLGGSHRGGDFDPGPGVFTLLPMAFYDFDAYVLKLDSNGIFEWAFSFGDTISQIDNVTDIDIFSNGNILITGVITGTSDIDPSANVFNMSSTVLGGTAFMASYSSAGQFLWAHTICDKSESANSDIYIDSQDNILLVGHFDSIADFDPDNTSQYNLQSVGYMDAYLAKYSSQGNFIYAKSWGGVNWENAFRVTKSSTNNIYIHGNYQSQLPDFDPTASVFLLDSTDEVNFFVMKLRDSSILYTEIDTLECDSLTYGGKAYFNSTSVTELFNNVDGYDSNRVVHIIIQSQELYADTVQSCTSINFGGQVISATGNYNHTFISSNGCDSNVILSFERNRLESFVQQNGLVLSDTNSNATYQWINCNPYTLISGATNQTYTVTANGDYAVVVTQNGCSDTSNCITFTNVSVNDISLNGIVVYPNPTESKFTISSTNNLKNAKLLILNSVGQVVYKKEKLTGHEFEVDITTYAFGLYTLELKEGEKVSRMKVMKH